MRHVVTLDMIDKKHQLPPSPIHADNKSITDVHLVTTPAMEEMSTQEEDEVSEIFKDLRGEKVNNKP